MAQPKSRLGRGLGSLISGGVSKATSTTAATSKAGGKKSDATTTSAVAESTAVEQVAGFLEIPIGKIEPNPYQPRREMDPAHIKELADSIRAEGLLQPIVVRKVSGRFQLIAGERRWRACQELKLKSIPARVLEASDSSSAVMSLVENLQREGLNPIEEAAGYASLLRDFDLTQELVAERVGKGRATIANALRLLNLPSDIQAYLARGMLSSGHAKVLLGLDDEAQQQALARKVIEDNLSVRQLEILVRKARENKGEIPGKLPKDLSAKEVAVIGDFERQLSSVLNTKVQLKHTPKKGRIVIEYFGNDDLQRIVEKLGVNA